MNRITIEDLKPELPTCQKWLMIIRHFLASPHGETAIGVDVLKGMFYEYKQAKKQDDGLGQIRALAGGQPDHFAADLAVLRQIPTAE